MTQNLQIIYNKALELAHNNQLEQARIMCEKLTEADKSNALYWLLHSAVLEHLGRLKEAEICIDSSIKYLPLIPQLHLTLGLIVQKQGNHLKAESCFKKAIRLKADYVEAIHELAGIYKITNRLQEALELFLESLRLRPHYPAALYNLGMLYYELGRPLDSLPLLNECLNISPDSKLALAGKVTVLERMGKYDEAREILNDCNSGDYSIPVALAYSLVASHFDDMVVPAIEYIARTIEKCTSSNNEISLLYFSLGRMYEKVNDYNNAFSCYKQANTHLGNTFDIKVHGQLVERIKETFGKNISTKSNAVEKKKLVFIVGMPRSGTTLIEKILDSHPDCFGAGELPFISEISNKLQRHISDKHIYPEIVTHLNSETSAGLAKIYINHIEKLSGNVPAVVDKMPANYLYLGIIGVLFPSAIIIHCRRNPLDTCLSCYFNNFGDRLTYTSDLSNLADYYQSYHDLMQFWHKHLNIPILDVKYEKLVTDQERITREMIEFCGLEWSQSCMEFFKNDRIARTASYDQVRKPIYSNSIGRWRRYESNIKELYNRLEPIIDAYNY